MFATPEELEKAIYDDLHRYYSIVDSENEARESLSLGEDDYLGDSVAAQFAVDSIEIADPSGDYDSVVETFWVCITAYYHDSGSNDYVYKVAVY